MAKRTILINYFIIYFLYIFILFFSNIFCVSRQYEALRNYRAISDMYGLSFLKRSNTDMLVSERTARNIYITKHEK